MLVRVLVKILEIDVYNLVSSWTVFGMNAHHVCWVAQSFSVLGAFENWIRLFILLVIAVCCEKINFLKEFVLLVVELYVVLALFLRIKSIQIEPAFFSVNIWT